MFSIPGSRLVSRARRKYLKQVKKLAGLVLGNRSIRSPIILVGAKGAFGHHHRAAEFVVTLKEVEF